MKICEALQDIKKQADDNVLNNSNIVKNDGFFKRMIKQLVSLIFDEKEINIDTNTTDSINNLIVDEYLKEYNGEVA